ncbi:murein biosynthesis integral membrane protein MurJ [candidate division WWE3 bacterium RIFOXYC1_FULL_40_10]|nr:MAG: murein biosynthesis integral membrane protein MurJ [candidate division WWE3 bacterium RIFOXYB1_FULL_40_22]OGC62049.1 MAG: murein biosynthesis integral membrane protein MurJ [candidate division WWE3 bacterium RIFOXYA1_FULL_40_11]OGC66432.1 MAG: murein biosynthesis integral membrane protein MurJ [candidate division WWE3 bacterium RIFOXYC1_FULL_40_10]OGC67244.1 MAG: murein biosynthesis integral membrane protein MurJ [candidate division WWE3 bacterium RIFOXYC2_FULL_40_11]OGC70749.1 MAG: mur
MELISSLRKFGTNSFLYRSQNTILSAAFILAIASGANAVLGLIKNRLLAGYFGISPELTVFFTAEKIPNMIYAILVVGAISTILIPVLSGDLEKNKEKAYESASVVITGIFFVFLIMATIFFILAPQIINLLSVGKFSGYENHLGTTLFRLMVGAQLILIAGSMVSSLLQSHKKFIFPALAPLLYNVGMILGIIIFSNKLGIFGPAFGVLIGAVLHLSIQLPALAQTGFKFKPSLNLKNKTMIKTLGLIPPRIISVLTANIAGTIDNSFAILISDPSSIILRFANQLQSFPVNIFGISLASASLPTLAAECSSEDRDKFKKTFITSLTQMVFLTAPLSAILLVLRVPAVRLVYGTPEFPWWATVTTAYTLAFYSLSIVPQSVNYLITRAFYAQKDTLTPAIVHVATTLIYIGLTATLILRAKYEVWVIAFTFSVTSYLDTFLLFYLLNRKVKGFDIERISSSLTKIGYSTLLMGLALYIPIKLLDQVIFDTAKTINLLMLTGIAGLFGMLTYLLLTKFFNVQEIELLYKVMRKLKFKTEQLPQDIKPTE